MALSNRDRVGRAFEVLAAGLAPYVDRRMKAKSNHGDRWFEEWASREKGEASLSDPALLLKVMADCWDLAFREELTRSDRNTIFELRDVRNRLAHNNPFSLDDAYRAVDSVERILVAIDATEAMEVGEAKDEIGRLLYAAAEKKSGRSQEALVTIAPAGLTPWRDVMVPHDDVARGRFALAEFAADLYQVHQGQGSSEYTDPVQFFERTFLTDGLRTLLKEATRRLASASGVPVVDLQTNFGGGKTHSQIALWHLFSGTPLERFPTEVRALMAEESLDTLPAVNRVVIVGTKVPPGQPLVKGDGTMVRTLWGELAWQLGGADAFAMVAESDANSVNPGEALNRLLARYAPCLILIDEWVAYARQLLGADALPGGTFETQFSFAQNLTEAANATPGALLVVSLPASETIEVNGSGGVGSDVELGGVGGREALAKLRNVVHRIESSWRPATAEESFEIVRRRLFKPVEFGREGDRDAVARSFGELYRKEGSEFPPECREPGYVERIKAAYPIHPELFARLYEDWSTLERFQRTRGVLRLMAGVIHALWEAGDQSPLIMPCSITLAEAAVAAELTRNLEDAWKPIVDTDIDGPNSLPVALDRELAGTLGRFQAARRVARTVFLGSAPTIHTANRGIDAARIRLGCVLPGETIATFGDALNRLSGRATYLYSDSGRYWYSVHPSVARKARDHADRLLSEARDEIHAAIIERLRSAESQRGEFRGCHVAPASSADVPDEPEVRLVVLGPDRPHIAKSASSAALEAATEILERRGTTPREYRNMVVFLAADHRRLEELERGVAEFLAWQAIDRDKGADDLNLDPQQARQAETKLAEADRAVALRVAEAYQWLLVPSQPEPTGAVVWETVKVDGQDPLAVRASRKLVNESHLYTAYPPVLLRQRLDGELAPLWESGHVSVSDLWNAFARYLYLPRLLDVRALMECVAGGPASFAPDAEGFATADLFDGGSYAGVCLGERATVGPTTLVVKPEVARQHLPVPSGGDVVGGRDEGTEGGETPPRPAPDVVRRFHGSVALDAARMNKEFGAVASEVIEHLASLLGTDVDVVVELAATNPEGFPDHIIRIVSENAKTLKFTDFGFEEG